jgi:putative two-component system response regulator
MLTTRIHLMVVTARKSLPCPLQAHINPNLLAYEVGLLTAVLCDQLGWAQAAIVRLVQAALLHDIGKSRLPTSLWSKPGALTEQEWTLARQHTQLGYALLKDQQDSTLELAAEVALYHHERFDGSGYPYQLQGKRIPLSARIVGICDVYDALRSRRSYKPGLSHQRALQIIYAGDGRTHPNHFDPLILECFREVAQHVETLPQYEKDQLPSAVGWP